MRRGDCGGVKTGGDRWRETEGEEVVEKKIRKGIVKEEMKSKRVREGGGEMEDECRRRRRG